MYCLTLQIFISIKLQKQTKKQANKKITKFLYNNHFIFFLIKRPLPTFLIGFLKSSTTVSFLTNIPSRFDKRNIDDIICSLNPAVYFIISWWSTVWYYFNFSLEIWPLALIISKLVICSFSKWLSVSCKNCSHFLCSYQANNPSLSYHG